MPALTIPERELPPRTQAGVRIGVHSSVYALGSLLAGGMPPWLPEQMLRELGRVEFGWRTVGVGSSYVTATGDRGLLGVLPVYPALGAHFAGWTPQRGFGDRADLAAWRRGVLIGCDAVGPSLFLVDPQSPTVAAELLRAALRLARRHGPDFVCLPHLPPGHHPLLDQVVATPARAVADEPSFWIDITFNTFDDYVASLRTARRCSVRQERRRFAESGLTVRTAALTGSMVQLLAPLLAQVDGKYGTGTEPSDGMRYLDSIATAMADQGKALVAFAGASPIAFTVVWNSGLDWRVRCFGCDYTRPEIREHAVYFNLGYYEPLVLAVAAGAPRLWLGMGSAETKQNRGAVAQNLRTVAWDGVPATV